MTPYRASWTLPRRLAAVALIGMLAWAPSVRSAGSREADAGPRDQPPVCTFIPPASYPDAATDRGLFGQVLVQVRVDSKGKVEGAALLTSDLPELFVAEALRAARRSRFEPARRHGRPADGKIVLAVHFQPAVRLRVVEAGLGRSVLDQKLQGLADRFTTGDAVAYLTRVQGAAAGDSLHHVWMHQGHAVLGADLPLFGADWTVWSSLTISPDQAGNWSVEARDGEGRVLARREFQCLLGEPVLPPAEDEEEKTNDRGAHP